MSLENNIQNIKNFLLDRYKDNLAAILIFGSANTGHFKEGESDIDHMIFLKEMNGINVSAEIKFLLEALKTENFASQYFHSLDGIKDYIKNRKSFSTYITIVSKDGSRTVYSTPEFEETRRYLREHPLTRKELQEHVKEKDDFELTGYFKKISGYSLTKALMAHLRRKLQIINFLKNDELIFDYERCLDNIDTDKETKETLMGLYQVYQRKKAVSSEEIERYNNLAKQFTQRIIEI